MSDVDTSFRMKPDSKRVTLHSALLTPDFEIKKRHPRVPFCYLDGISYILKLTVVWKKRPTLS